MGLRKYAADQFDVLGSGRNRTPPQISSHTLKNRHKNRRIFSPRVCVCLCFCACMFVCVRVWCLCACVRAGVGQRDTRETGGPDVGEKDPFHLDPTTHHPPTLKTDKETDIRR